MAGKNGAVELRKLADMGEYGIKFEPTALVISTDITYTQAKSLCRGIGGFHDASKWWLGDIQIFLEDLFGPDKLAQLAEETGRSFHTLENYRWVSSHVAMPRRRAHLAHSYHAEVAALPPDDQIEWLDRVEANDWKVADLRFYLREERRQPAKEQPLWSDATIEPDLDRVAVLSRRVVQEAQPTGDGSFIVPGEVIVQLRAAFGEGD